MANPTLTDDLLVHHPLCHRARNEAPAIGGEPVRLASRMTGMRKPAARATSAH